MDKLGFLLLVGLGTRLVWVGLETLWKRWRERRGKLAGIWFQTTYPPEDVGSRIGVWSIELVIVRHRRKRLTGTMIRVHSQEYSRRWQFEGRIVGDHILLTYWPIKDAAGGQGTAVLTRMDTGEYAGKFFSTVNAFADDGMKASFYGAPMVWGKVNTPAAGPVWDLLTEAEKVLANKIMETRSHPVRAAAVEFLSSGGPHVGRMTWGAAYKDLTPIYAEKIARRMEEKPTASRKGVEDDGESPESSRRSEDGTSDDECPKSQEVPPRPPRPQPN